MRVVLLGPPPSLHCLRQGLPLFVRSLHRYYAAVRPLQCVRARRSALRLRGPVYYLSRRPGGLPVLVHVVSRRARVFDHAASRLGSRYCRLKTDVAFPLSKQGRHAIRQFSGLNRPARRCLYLRFAVRLAAHHARLKVRIESLLLFCRALSSPTTCRFIPAHLLASIARLRFTGTRRLPCSPQPPRLKGTFLLCSEGDISILP